MDKPVVSIITPTYNHARFIERCIASVRQQTYVSWEQLVVDDGSTDDTAAIVEAVGDPRVRCIRLPHRGLGALADTYNTGLLQARGDIIAVLEGDDAWPADKLERQLPAFEDPEVYLSWGRAIVIDEAGGTIGEVASLTSRRARLQLASRTLFQRLTRSNVLAPSLTILVRRGALDRAGGFRQSGSSLYADLPTWLWLAATNPGAVCFMNEILGFYRLHPHQTTRLYGDEMSTQHFQVVLEVVRQLEPSHLEAVGWDQETRQRAELNGLLAEGVRCLHDGDLKTARTTFFKALRNAGSVGDRGKAGIGIISSTAGFDLLTAAYRLRGRAGTWLRRHLRPAAHITYGPDTTDS